MKMWLTQESSEEEWGERNIDDGRNDVDEPVGKKWGDPQEDDVVQQTVFLPLNLSKQKILVSRFERRLRGRERVPALRTELHGLANIYEQVLWRRVRIEDSSW